MKKVIKYMIVATIALFAGNSFAEAQQANVPYIKLNNGLKMPRFGLGTFNTPSHEAAKQAVIYALQNGYRHIDTAHAYGNERAIGEGIKESGIPREEVWVTSKLWPSDYADGNTLESIDKMLERLQTDYLDLLYIHQPVGEYIEAWRDMEKAVEAGKVRALGLSNFDATREGFDAILTGMKIKPVAMQIECHPYAQRRDIRVWLEPYEMVQECWYPLGSGSPELLSDPAIKTIADKYGKTNAQVIIRWHIQEGFSVIPGATNPDYITENINIFDFELSEDDMAVMRSLDRQQRFFNMTYEQVERMASGWVIQD